MRDTLTSLRYRYWPDHLLGEILSKRWTETAIPVILLLIVGFALSRSIDHFLSPSSLADTARQAGEIGFIGLGMALVVIVGGIDLSVGSIFALTDFCALYLLDVLNWPGASGGGRHSRLRRTARRRQRRPDRLLAAPRLHHHADHPDHLPFGFRSPDPALLQFDRRRLSRHPVLEFHRRAATCSAFRASRSSTSRSRSSATSS